MKDTLMNSKPVRPEFETVCKQAEIPYTYAEYHAFVRANRKIIEKYRYHPIYRDDEYFYDTMSSELAGKLKKWSMLRTADDPCTAEGCCSLAAMAGMCHMAPEKLIDWLADRNEEISFEKGRMLIKTAFAEAVAKDLKNIIKVSSLLPNLMEHYPELPATAIRGVVAAHLTQAQPSWLLKCGDLPGLQQKEPSYLASNQHAVWSELSRVIGQAPLLPMVKLRTVTGLSNEGLEERIKLGIIHASKQNGMCMISVDEMHRVKRYADTHISLDHVVGEVLLQTGNDAFGWNKQEQRRKLTDCFEGNGYWGMRIYDARATPLSGGAFGKIIQLKDVKGFREKAALAIACVGQSHEICCRTVLDAYRGYYPRTVAKLGEFLKVHHLYEEQRTVNMLDFLMYQLQTRNCELDELDDDGIAQLVTAYLETTKTSGELFVRFLNYGGYTAREYRYSSAPRQTDYTAYPAEDFAVIVAYVVNEDLWAEVNLVQKALKEPRCAELWLYIALHVFAAWRSTDYVRLEPPLLRYSWMETEERIASAAYTQEDAEYVARTFIGKIDAMQMRPNKTNAYDQVPTLFFNCPENCLAPFGVILSVAASHYYKKEPYVGKTFVVVRKDLRTIRRFFGENMVRACGNKDFSGLRANKSVLQCVSTTALDDGQSPYMAYLLASLMRSHKGGYGTLAQTTELYLRDANFAGEDPNYIIYQMFLRGICSFAVDLLLKQCYGESYDTLSVEGKTECITTLGVSNYQIDQLKRCIAEAQDSAMAVITSISAEKTARRPKDILISLTNGHGHGKDRCGLCIAKAAGLQCRFPDRQGCLGCQYEVKTKALLLRYLSNYDRLHMIAEGTGVEFEKRKAMSLMHAQFTAISEIAHHLSAATTAAEMRVYRDLMADMQRGER